MTENTIKIELPEVEITFGASHSNPDRSTRFIDAWIGTQAAVPHTGDEVWLNTDRSDEALYRVLRRRWFHVKSVEVYVELVLDSDADR